MNTKKIGILGTGMVGKTLGSRLIDLGYLVRMGSRSASNPKALEWVEKCGQNASTGTFEDAVNFADIILNCTKGDAAHEVFRLAGLQNFTGKIIVDISNPLDFSQGMPPFLIPEFANTSSLAESLQNLVPDAYLVKSLNIVNCEVMANPSITGAEPTMMLSGNNTDSKARVADLLREFGWKDIIDLGDISTARGTEMMLPIWLRLWMATGNGHLAFKIIR